MNNPQPATKREVAQTKFQTARSNLILMVAFTAINMLLLAFGSETMLLFSATIPYVAVVIGTVSEVPAILASCTIFAVAVLALYFVCWIFSKKQYGWMIAALVFFILDTLFMGGMYLLAQDISGILDVAIHIWVLYYLIIGVKYGAQLKSLPEEEPTAFEAIPTNADVPAEADTNTLPNGDSAPLRRADDDVKFRVLLQGEALGHDVCYRRVKRTNELVIDGYVYDEIEMLVEPAHLLGAVIDGHTITVGFDGIRSFLDVDDNRIAKKMRWY